MHAGRKRCDFAVPAKLWVTLWIILGVFLAADARTTWVLALMSFLYIAAQLKWRAFWSYAAFYGVLSLLLFLIRHYGLRMWFFSEYHVFVFWLMTGVFAVSWDLMTTPPGNISAFLSRVRTPSGVILGVLVIFRFFPTMKTELRGVRESMHNRGLTVGGQVLLHPAATFEYILVPILMRCLQIADQLSVSAVSRGIEAPGVRSSYYATSMRLRDYTCIAACTVYATAFLILGGVGWLS
jgi:energy-coupling factor transport system permease protein